MFTHLLIGTLFLALACFTIGLLAGGPDLVRRRQRSRDVYHRQNSDVVIRPKQITRADMRIEP